MPPAPPRWMTVVLLLAGAYNLLWGAVILAFPAATLRLLGMPPVNLEIWQCLGMVVGVYGVGYAIAARDPVRHWPIVLVGFLGKAFGPIGFLHGALTGRLPWSFGWVNVGNDLVWLVPFVLILLHAWRAEHGLIR